MPRSEPYIITGPRRSVREPITPLATFPTKTAALASLREIIQRWRGTSSSHSVTYDFLSFGTHKIPNIWGGGNTTRTLVDMTLPVYSLKKRTVAQQVRQALPAWLAEPSNGSLGAWESVDLANRLVGGCLGALYATHLQLLTDRAELTEISEKDSAVSNNQSWVNVRLRAERDPHGKSRDLRNISATVWGDGVPILTCDYAHIERAIWYAAKYLYRSDLV